MYLHSCDASRAVSQPVRGDPVGRPPKPSAAKVLHGTFRADRAAGTEPKPTTKPKCPRWLAGPARTCWRRLVPDLHRVGILTGADADVMAAFCQARSDFEAAARELADWRARTNGTATVSDRFGQLKPHPAIAMQATAISQLRQLGSQLGLTPSGRVRLGAPGGDPENDNPDDVLD